MQSVDFPLSIRNKEKIGYLDSVFFDMKVLWVVPYYIVIQIWLKFQLEKIFRICWGCVCLGGSVCLMCESRWSPVTCFLKSPFFPSPDAWHSECAIGTLEDPTGERQVPALPAEPLCSPGGPSQPVRWQLLCFIIAGFMTFRFTLWFTFSHLLCCVVPLQIQCHRKQWQIVKVRRVNQPGMTLVSGVVSVKNAFTSDTAFPVVFTWTQRAALAAVRSGCFMGQQMSLNFAILTENVFRTVP